MTTTKSELELELDLYKTVRQIPYYSDFFYPVFEVVPIELETHFTNSTTIATKNVTYKTKNIETVSLKEMMTQYSQRYPKLLKRYIMKCSRDLIEAVTRLQKANIFDVEINEDTIRCRTIDGRPIIVIQVSTNPLSIEHEKKRWLQHKVAILIKTIIDPLPLEIQSIVNE